MKTIKSIVLFIIIFPFSLSIINAQTAGWESYEIIDRLLTIRQPGAPIIHGNYVIFTADSSYRRVGAAFAHENFAITHWYTPLLVSQDRMFPILLPGQTEIDPYRDSGIQFLVYEMPAHLRELEYRIVVNGLWTADAFNPNIRRDPLSGLNMSVLPLPQRPLGNNPLNGLPDGLRFTFSAPPGEIVTVAGTFNGWDPFMYELKEGPAGFYSLTLPLPQGTYQYVFFHRGQRHVDANNPSRVYARDGSAASQIIVP